MLDFATKFENYQQSLFLLNVRNNNYVCKELIESDVCLWVFNEKSMILKFRSTLYIWRPFGICDAMSE
jgi:hypothetical protein